MAFQQVTEVQQRRDIRGRLPAQVDANKAANGLTVVGRLLCLHPKDQSTAGQCTSATFAQEQSATVPDLRYWDRTVQSSAPESPTVSPLRSPPENDLDASAPSLTRIPVQKNSFALSLRIGNLTDRIFSNTANIG